MDDRDLQMLIAFKRCRTISQAAEELYVSQPALSKRLRNLENEFNTKLIQTRKSGLTFTPTGELLHAYAMSALALLEEVKAKILRIEDDRKILRIGAAPMFSQLMLPVVIQTFAKQYPDVYPHIRSGFSGSLVDNLIKGEVHAAFIRGEYEPVGYERYIISSDPLLAVSKQQLNQKDLYLYPRITYDTDISLMKQIETWFEEQYGVHKTFVAMHVGDSQTCLHSVAQGIGYTIVPYYILSGWRTEDFCLTPLKDTNGNLLTRETHLFYSLQKCNDFLPLKNFVTLVKTLFPSNSNNQ